MKIAIIVIAVAVLVFILGWTLQRQNTYRVISYADRDIATGIVSEAAVRRVNYFGVPFGRRLHIKCFGSLDKKADLSSPGYRTSPDRAATWDGAVGTEHWIGRGCRPLPISFNVRFDREKYPANYLDYDTAQENTDTWFWHSYWEIRSEQ